LPKEDEVVKVIAVPTGIPVEIATPKYDEVPMAPKKQDIQKPQ
jgi:hypothetical protein